MLRGATEGGPTGSAEKNLPMICTQCFGLTYPQVSWHHYSCSVAVSIVVLCLACSVAVLDEDVAFSVIRNCLDGEGRHCHPVFQPHKRECADFQTLKQQKQITRHSPCGGQTSPANYLPTTWPDVR